MLDTIGNTRYEYNMKYDMEYISIKILENLNILMKT